MCFRRRKKGPRTYAEWDAALSAALSFEHAEYLSRGTLGEKELYASLFNRISDYVTGRFNESVTTLDREVAGTEAVFLMREFEAKLGLMAFYRKLDFVKDRDSGALAASLGEAVESVAAGLKTRYGAEDPDIKYEVGALLRAFRENHSR